MIPVFREPTTQKIKVEHEGYIPLEFTAKIPTWNEIETTRLQVATSLSIGKEYIYELSFDEILGYVLLDKHLVDYPLEITKVFESLPEAERNSWKFFPDKDFRDALVTKLIEKTSEIENGKKKSKALDAIRQPAESTRLVRDTTPQDLPEVMDIPRSSTTASASSSSSFRVNDKPTEPIKANSPTKSKGVGHRMQSNRVS